MLNPEEMHDKLLSAGGIWADAKAAYEAMEAVSKTLLAKLRLAYATTCKTVAEAEVRALADEQYESHLNALAVAREKWLHAEVRYKSIQAYAEYQRSAESTRRAEMRM